MTIYVCGETEAVNPNRIHTHTHTHENASTEGFLEELTTSWDCHNADKLCRWTGGPGGEGERPEPDRSVSGKVKHWKHHPKGQDHTPTPRSELRTPATETWSEYSERRNSAPQDTSWHIISLFLRFQARLPQKFLPHNRFLLLNITVATKPESRSIRRFPKSNGHSLTQKPSTSFPPSLSHPHAHEALYKFMLSKWKAKKFYSPARAWHGTKGEKDIQLNNKINYEAEKNTVSSGGCI